MLDSRLYRIIVKGHKDFLARAREEGVDLDTGIVTEKLNEKRLEPRTKVEY